ncbi:hypothetical protein [Streptomyces antarcticus]|uniref:hypothetical protein n=1 Tax=Streptomyces antarcticus TaxID=2996458 RepID=UPI00226E95BD|nr:MULTISPECIES: hypothetical protein [unclassified Streptomyces]MCY0940493.1 hypothetical protein [Streptomyces sp. H34-AA3]MCZ4082388.1 hypothetical protein [Streptomyces sp. H34-S5]
MRRWGSWGEAALVAAVCWAVSGLGYTASAALDEPQLSVAPLVGAGLVQWFWARHRSWPAGVAAGLVGAAVLFALVDMLRPELGRYVADALATGVAATVSVAVLTAVGRVRERRHAAAP